MCSNLAELKLNIDELEKIINYYFKNKQNIILALTHSSYANENKTEKLRSNERLEFLGDSILSLAISEKIYKNYTNLAEGDMTKLRASIVCEQSLVKCANNINLGKFIMLGKGEVITGGRYRKSILSDAFESLIGAIYIDDGFESARDFIYEHMKTLIDFSIKGMIFIDYKTQLQEFIQKNNLNKIEYKIIKENGPDHNKIFVSQASVNNEVIGVGEGKSKKEAEQNAAKDALSKMGELNES
jgi:ribonuclease III